MCTQWPASITDGIGSSEEQLYLTLTQTNALFRPKLGKSPSWELPNQSLVFTEKEKQAAYRCYSQCTCFGREKGEGRTRGLAGGSFLEHGGTLEQVTGS